jgi:hypothetical protein
MMNSEQNDEVSDTTGDDSSNADDNHKIEKRFDYFHFMVEIKTRHFRCGFYAHSS